MLSWFVRNDGKLIPNDQSLLDASYSFSGHETFPLRYTWLPKAAQRLEQHPDLFTRKDAFVLLGVGKNMVRSIRHWGQAFGVLEQPERSSPDHITSFGKQLLGEGGWDPYLEDPGTLWLLHWHVVSHPAKASTWYLAFTQWNRETFTRPELISWLLRVAEDRAGAATQGSIERDVSVFIRTYVPSEIKPTLPLEESFDSPLVELGLIREVDKDTYQFVRGPKLMLHDKIFVYALLDYWQRVAAQQQTLSFEAVLHGRGSPGAAFKLSENALADRLERLPDWTGLRFDDTAGMRQLLRSSPLLMEPLEVLECYYRPGIGVPS